MPQCLILGMGAISGVLVSQGREKPKARSQKFEQNEGESARWSSAQAARMMGGDVTVTSRQARVRSLQCVYRSHSKNRQPSESGQPAPSRYAILDLSRQEAREGPTAHPDFRTIQVWPKDLQHSATRLSVR
jgi:hypothetical protein